MQLILCHPTDKHPWGEARHFEYSISQEHLEKCSKELLDVMKFHPLDYYEFIESSQAATTPDNIKSDIEHSFIITLREKILSFLSTDSLENSLENILCNRFIEDWPSGTEDGPTIKFDAIITNKPFMLFNFEHCVRLFFKHGIKINEQKIQDLAINLILEALFLIYKYSEKSTNLSYQPALLPFLLENKDSYEGELPLLSKILDPISFNSSIFLNINPQRTIRIGKALSNTKKFEVFYGSQDKTFFKMFLILDSILSIKFQDTVGYYTFDNSIKHKKLRGFLEENILSKYKKYHKVGDAEHGEEDKIDNILLKYLGVDKTEVSNKKEEYSSYSVDSFNKCICNFRSCNRMTNKFIREHSESEV